MHEIRTRGQVPALEFSICVKVYYCLEQSIMYEENVKIVRKVNTNRPKMSRENRAKQFAPFAALKGFEEGIKWKEKVYVDKRELSEESLERLDNKFKEIKKNDIITVVYYNKGEYLKVTGMVARIDVTARILQVINTKIRFEDIYDIETGND